MAKKKKEAEVVDDLEGTVEGQALECFEREKAAYEERTGEKVNYELPIPVTRTPIKAVERGELTVESEESAEFIENEGDSIE